MATSLDEFNAGRLHDAVQAAIEEVRESPSDIDKRWMLATLFCFEGDLDRADKHLQTILSSAPDLSAEVLLFRNLLRGEAARRQCFDEGRVPAFPDSPSELHRQLLKALALMSGGESEQGARLLGQIADSQPKLSGECNGDRFIGLRDWDDVLATIFEVITVNGDYYWLAMDQLHEINFAPVAEPRDMLWRGAQIVTYDHESLAVHFPVLYPGSSSDGDDAIRLGRAADWVESPEGVRRGKGVRSFLIGDETRPLTNIDTLRLEVPAQSPQPN
jgi:type VI secretion system protein ImpE